MTEALAGPYCAMLLGDLGADVMKVERPDVGDQARSWGPPFLEGESAYFLAVNRNKRSVELDSKDPTDSRSCCNGSSHARTFFSPTIRGSIRSPAAGSIPRRCAAAIRGSSTPRSAATVISGPKANRGGYDIIAQGEAGLMALTGPTEGGPSRFPSPMADISGGIYACLGVLAALYARDSSDARNGRRPIHRRLARRRADELAGKHRRELLRDGQAAAAARQCASERDAVSARARSRQDDDHRGRQRAALGEILQGARRRRRSATIRASRPTHSGT